jgi:phosphoserine aminotransferase
MTIESRKHNFSGGPGALPEVVLQEAQQAVGQLPGTGLSILGVSHRSALFAGMVEEAEANILRLLGLGPGYRVLFLQGGATLQFSMVPIHLLRGQDRPAEYVVTGHWSARSVPEARLEGPVRVLWDGAGEGFVRVPRAAELDPSPVASYLHYVSNETVEGLQFHELLGHDEVPRVCDMSSDFLSRPVDLSRFDLVYAHAQKNLGPAGVTVVVLRDWILERSPRDVPSMLQYRTHAQHASAYNTPPVFAIYVVLLVSRWLLRDIGGLPEMGALNAQKAARLYRCLDDHPAFFVPHAAPASRSQMNVTFRLADRGLETRLVVEADERGLHGLGGHRTLGGLRVSLYNAVTLEAVDALCAFLEAFADRHRSR